MPGREARPRLYEACVPIGNRHGQAGPDDRPRTGSELDALRCGEVEAGVAFVRLRREDRILAQSLDRKLDQFAERAGASRASASRYGA